MFDLKNQWDDKIGLFLLPPGKSGHTLDCFNQKNLHSLPDSVSFMIYAAQVGRLDEIDNYRILENIRKCQFTDCERRGQIKWFLEDRDKTDGNASFFICTGLIPLRKYFSSELGDKCNLLIDEIISETLHHSMKKFDQCSCYYPNSFLGEIAFAWIINEMCGQENNDEFLLKTLNDSIRYWNEENWGWGEHMSDCYSPICCYVISMLLLMSNRLPEYTREMYLEALSKLLEIEDIYGAKPRVPAIRSYSFIESPKVFPFRQEIREWQPEENIIINNLPAIGPILTRLGWHDMAPPISKAQREVEIACFNDTKASALIEDDFRIGAMSRYPIMECSDYQVSGMSWQSFPVSFLHDDGDWGFLQWSTQEDGKTYAHPCHQKKHDIIKGLSTKINPPIIGNTFSLREAGNLLVLRRMPAISTVWTRLSDRLRVVSPASEFEEKKISDNCSTMLFKWRGGRILSVARVTFSDIPTHMNMRIKDEILDWDIEYGKQSIKNMNDAVILWAFSIDAEIINPPTIKPVAIKRRPFEKENGIFYLDWKAGNFHWNMKIDPVAKNPFITEF